MHLVAGTRRVPGEDPYLYVGVLRVGRRVVLECGHRHRNRDVTTRVNGRSARSCVEDLVAAAGRPALADERARKIRDAWSDAPVGGWQVTRAQLDRFRTGAASDAEEYLRRVERARELVAAHPAAPTRVAAAQPARQEEVVGEMPEWML